MIEGTNGCMSKIGEIMFGMLLEGEMLDLMQQNSVT
jgi:hypothetical protein